MRTFQLDGDITTDMIDHLPLDPAARRASGALITPYDGLYDEGKAALLTMLHDHGIRTITSTIGGDEMVALTGTMAISD